MSDSNAFEKLSDKLAKLRAMRDCASATAGERENAQASIDALLRKHGLTEEQAASVMTGVVVFSLEPARWGKRLFLQCAAWLLQVNTIHTIRAPKGRVAMMLTPLDGADIKGCYAYYVLVMRKREVELRQMMKDTRSECARILKALKEERDGLCEALLHKYELFGPPPAEPKKHRRMTEAEFESYLKRKRFEEGFEADAWQRGGKLNQQDLPLLGPS